MRLLLISNSTNAGEAYLEHPKREIQKFLGRDTIEALFIPYAAVTFSYDDYEAKVNNRFAEIGHRVRSIHRYDDPQAAVEKACKAVPGTQDAVVSLEEKTVTVTGSATVADLKKAIIDAGYEVEG